jgi:hypothetical protein
MLEILKTASQRLQQMEAVGVVEVATATNIKDLLARLKAGQKWLAVEHRLWITDDPQAASDAKFSAALAGWDSLERVFRCSGYAGCIWGPGGSCPEDSPVLCDGCVMGTAKPAEQLSLVVV